MQSTLVDQLRTLSRLCTWLDSETQPALTVENASQWLRTGVGSGCALPYSTWVSSPQNSVSQSVTVPWPTAVAGASLASTTRSGHPCGSRPGNSAAGEATYRRQVVGYEACWRPAMHRVILCPDMNPFLTFSSKLESCVSFTLPPIVVVRSVLDRCLIAVCSFFGLLLLGGALSAPLQTLLMLLSALSPILAPYCAACARNARFRSHPHTGVFIGRARASREPGGRLRVTVSDVDGSLARTVSYDSSLEEGLRGPVEAYALVVSDEPGFRKCSAVGEIYLPTLRRWVSEYPYVRRKPFQEVAVQADLFVRANPRPVGSG